MFKNNMGNIIVESISSKNLFNINDVRQKSSNYSISKNSINISFIDGNAGYVKFNIIDNINNDYTISFNNNGNMIRLLIVPYDSSNNIIANLTIEGFTYNSLYQAFYGDTFSNSLSISLNSNVAKFQIGFVCIVNPSQTISNIQLEKGNEATAYTEYKLFDCTFLTEQPEIIFDSQVYSQTNYNFLKNISNYRFLIFSFNSSTVMHTPQSFKKMNDFSQGVKFLTYQNIDDKVLIMGNIKYLDDNSFRCEFSGYKIIGEENYYNNPWWMVIYGVK